MSIVVVLLLLSLFLRVFLLLIQYGVCFRVDMELCAVTPLVALIVSGNNRQWTMDSFVDSFRLPTPPPSSDSEDSEQEYRFGGQEPERHPV
jgi:hypothetical protein